MWNRPLGQLINQECSDNVSRKYNEERSEENKQHASRYGIHPFGRTWRINCLLCDRPPQ
jgi:hypothetical protein